jgi:hypothetical protein
VDVLTLGHASADFSIPVTATTFEPDGDTASGDTAAIGYTAAEGLILTGQGSTSDVTIKNDADETVISIPTGTSNVGIGTSSPTYNLDVHGGTGTLPRIRVQNTGTEASDSAIVQIGISGTTAESYIYFADSGDSNVGQIRYDHASDYLSITTNASEAMRIDSSGNVGIGTSSPSRGDHGSVDPKLHVDHVGSTGVFTLVSRFESGGDADDTGAAILINHQNDRGLLIEGGRQTGDQGVGHLGLVESDGTNERILTLLQGGNVGIGTSSPAHNVEIVATASGSINDSLQIRNNATASGTGSRLRFINSNASNSDTNGAAIASVRNGDDNDLVFEAENSEAMRIDHDGKVGIGTSSPSEELDVSGNVTISGSLSKGSGSFKIDHPLSEKTNTHYLVHSFVESPQADNIYRGKVDLVNGTATVNIDTVAGMSEGTFALLNREIQCFTSNETGWTAVKGSVSNNILTITAQDETCTDTISWLVIGERQDQHMYDTEWTDENGKVIVEPLKSVEEENLET